MQMFSNTWAIGVFCLLSNGHCFLHIVYMQSVWRDVRFVPKRDKEKHQIYFILYKADLFGRLHKSPPCIVCGSKNRVPPCSSCVKRVPRDTSSLLDVRKYSMGYTMEEKEQELRTNERLVAIWSVAYNSGNVLHVLCNTMLY